MKKKELEDLEKDELIKECKNRGRLIKIILKEIKELKDRSQYNLHYNSIPLGKPEIISPGRDFLAGKFQKEY